MSEETLYTYYQIDLEDASVDWDCTICESLEEVMGVLRFLDTDLDDPERKTKVTITGIGMSRQAYYAWGKEHIID